MQALKIQVAYLQRHYGLSLYQARLIAGLYNGESDA